MSGTQQLCLLTQLDAVTALDREDEEIRVNKALALKFIIDVGFESFVYKKYRSQIYEGTNIIPGYFIK